MYIGMGASPVLLTPTTYNQVNGLAPYPDGSTVNFAQTIQRAANAALGGDAAYMTTVLGIVTTAGDAFETSIFNSLLTQYNNLILGPSASQGSLSVPSSHVYGIPQAPISGTIKAATASGITVPSGPPPVTVVDLQRAVNSALNGNIAPAQGLLQRTDLDPLHASALKDLVAAFQGRLTPSSPFYQGSVWSTPLKVQSIKLPPPPKFDMTPVPTAPGTDKAVTSVFDTLMTLTSGKTRPNQVSTQIPFPGVSPPTPASPFWGESHSFTSPLQAEMLEDRTEYVGPVTQSFVASGTDLLYLLTSRGIRQ